MIANTLLNLLSKYRVLGGLAPVMPLVLSLLLVFLLIIGTPSAPYSSSTTTSRISNTALEKVATPLFVDTTLISGLAFSHLQGDKKLTGLNEVLGPGACVLDYDNDGWMDLFLVNGSGQTRFYGSRYWWHLPQGHRLYRNLGNNKFKDITESVGLNTQSWGMGCTVGDFDNDGNSDLLITNYGSNLLYKNNGRLV